MPDDIKGLGPVAVRTRFGISMLPAIVYGLLLYLLIWGAPVEGGVAFVTGLFLLPMGIAAVVSAFADPRATATEWRHIRNGWFVIAILLVLSAVVMGEGAVCIVVATPMLGAGSAVGSATTLWVLRRLRRPSATGLVMVLPLLGLPVEHALVFPEKQSEVRTVIEIDAPVNTVWRNTIEIRNVEASELPFTFSHGIVGVPHPENARLEGRGIGAVRHLRWTQGVRFQEVVTAWEENSYLAWDFRFGPESIPAAIDAHIDVDSSYLKLATGNYLLEPLPGGRTPADAGHAVSHRHSDECLLRFLGMGFPEGFPWRRPAGDPRPLRAGPCWRGARTRIR